MTILAGHMWGCPILACGAWPQILSPPAVLSVFAQDPTVRGCLFVTADSATDHCQPAPYRYRVSQILLSPIWKVLGLPATGTYSHVSPNHLFRIAARMQITMVSLQKLLFVHH